MVVSGLILWRELVQRIGNHSKFLLENVIVLSINILTSTLKRCSHIAVYLTTKNMILFYETKHLIFLLMINCVLWMIKFWLLNSYYCFY